DLQGLSASEVAVFHAPILLQRVVLDEDALFGPSQPQGQQADDYLGRVVVGMSNEAFSSRQQLILLKATGLALFALLLTFLLARRLARNLAQPISAMGEAVKAIQAGDYRTRLPE